MNIYNNLFAQKFSGSGGGGDSGIFSKLIDGSITELVVPNGITSINNYLCYNDTNLASVSIPGSVISIGASAFYGCTALKEIDFTVQEGATIGQNIFRGCTGLESATIRCNAATFTIPSFTFYQCTSLRSLTLSGITGIGQRAFSGCTSLTEIEIPSTVTIINTTAFENCSNITQITVNAAQDSISGAPWGAKNATVVWAG